MLRPIPTTHPTTQLWWRSHSLRSVAVSPTTTTSYQRAPEKLAQQLGTRNQLITIAFRISMEHGIKKINE
jgi:hypothetical protein